MKFNLTDRTLMKMLFERGTVTQFSGCCTINKYERIWTVMYHPVTIMRAEPFYSAVVSGIYNEMAMGDTLDECLDNLESIIKEVAA